MWMLVWLAGKGEWGRVVGAQRVMCLAFVPWQDQCDAYRCIAPFAKEGLAKLPELSTYLHVLLTSAPYLPV